MQKSFLKKGLTEIHTVVSEEGEIVGSNQKHHTYVANSKEEFVLVYASLLGVFEELSGVEIKVYSYLLNHYNFKSWFIINNILKEEISSKINVSVGAISNALTELKNKNLLFSPQKTKYMLNPRYAFKGSTGERNKSLKAIIELGCKNC